ncbi:MAG: hypothetical protein MH252_08485 [Thermosynechococcaceae cyanobacterium MS004]|nr:hypothetical protein [Thermosynechococcaceae cyanobacterium MS004]
MAREEILRAVKARLESMTTANGYGVDLGLNVHYFQDFPEVYDGPPALAFFDEEEENAEVGYQQERRLKMRVDAVAYIQSDAIAESCGLLSDVIRAIGVDRQWGGHALNTTLGTNEKHIEAMGRRACRVTQEFEIVYRVGPFES